MRADTPIGTSYPEGWPPVLLHHHFLAPADRDPAAPALRSSGRTWTYGELAEHARGFAEILAAAGVGPADRVILQVDTTPEAVALICASSMLGAIFIPVSTDAPPEWLEHILAVTEPTAHVRPPDVEPPGRGGAIRVSAVASERGLEIEAGGSGAPRGRASPVLESDVAYVIFTSGTTGRPKGIKMSHRAVLAFFRGLVHFCGLGPDERVGTIAPLQFDLSLLDMGLAFGSGATLVQVSRALFYQPKRLVAYLAENRVTQMNCVPSVWVQLVRSAPDEIAALTDLKATLFAGEYFPLESLRRLQALRPNLRAINCFGQSESIASTFHDLPNPIPADARTIPVGVPHPGVDYLLLDANQEEIVEPGGIGEIYLRGAGLFSGYWRDEEATARALVVNPLRPETGERVFRTGDLAFRDEQGLFHFTGRRDLQVQILGNRVEIEEVEQKLGSHPRIHRVAVAALDGELGPELVAFVVRAPDAEGLDHRTLAAFCREALPRYMWPKEFVSVDEIPLTTNGKVDRERLLAEYAG